MEQEQAASAVQNEPTSREQDGPYGGQGAPYGRQVGPYGGPLRRSAHCKMLGGVAGGLAQHFGLDVMLVRIGIGALALAGIGLPLYLAAWLCIPEEGQDRSIADDMLEDIFGNRVRA